MQERRVEARMLCSELVDVSWRDTRGRQRKAMANLEDISNSGVCLQLDIPLPLNTLLHILHPRGEFQGNVRYCLYREIGYFLGVQFAPGCTWSPDSYQPSHLLDLRTLVTRSAKRSDSKTGQDEAAQ